MNQDEGNSGRKAMRVFRAPGILSRALSMAVILGGAAWAQAQERSPARDSWTRLAPAQFQDVVSLFVRDGHLVWLERRLDPSTAEFRAQSHWYRLFRSRLDAPSVTTLHAPEAPTTDGPACVAGAEGVVVWHDRGRDARLFLPGKAPVLFEGKQPNHSFDAPLRIYPEGLLCRTNFSGVTWIPLKDGDPEYLRRQGVLAWEEDKKQNCDFEGDCIADGGQIVYTRRPRTKMNSPGEPETVLYDLPAKREIWTAKGWPIGLDGTHVFQTPHEWGYAVSELWRRRREGKGEGDRLALPWRTVLIIDFQAPHLLALFYGDGGPVPGHLDVETGSYREFDWTPSNKEHPQRRSCCLSDALYIGHHPVGGDAKTGVLVVATGGAIFRVPWRGDAKQLPLKWSPGDLK